MLNKAKALELMNINIIIPIKLKKFKIDQIIKNMKIHKIKFQNNYYKKLSIIDNIKIWNKQNNPN